jgi:Aspartate/ornithine carbamoyltransferase, Asp/Orn binding domain
MPNLPGLPGPERGRPPRLLPLNQSRCRVLPIAVAGQQQAVRPHHLRVLRRLPLQPGRSLLVTGDLGSDVRLAYSDDPGQAVSGVDLSAPTCGSRWAKPRRSGPNGCGSPYQVNADLLREAHNPAVKFMHRPARVPRPEHRRRAGDHGAHRHDLRLEVAGEVFGSPASIVFDQAENRLHTIKAVLVATLGGLNAC